MTPTNPTDALTNGQYEVDDYGSIGEAARRICCFCEGDMRRLVYITAKEELAATEARAQGLVELLEMMDSIEYKELNLSNYTHDDVCALNNAYVEMQLILTQALATWRRT